MVQENIETNPDISVFTKLNRKHPQKEFEISFTSFMDYLKVLKLLDLLVEWKKNIIIACEICGSITFKAYGLYQINKSLLNSYIDGVDIDSLEDIGPLAQDINDSIFIFKPIPDDKIFNFLLKLDNKENYFKDETEGFLSDEDGNIFFQNADEVLFSFKIDCPSCSELWESFRALI